MLFALILAACSRTPPPVFPLASMDHAMHVPPRMQIRFTAVSRPDQIGIRFVDWPNGDGGRSYNRLQYWFVPLVDPDNPDPELIPAWIGNHVPAPKNATPDAWLERMQRGIDHKEVTLIAGATRAGNAADRPPGFWAINEAERQHGIRSHPNAPMFLLDY